MAVLETIQLTNGLSVKLTSTTTQKMMTVTMISTGMMMTKAELLDKITALTEENRRLQESQDNTGKMLKVVLSMLDKKMHL